MECTAFHTSFSSIPVKGSAGLLGASSLWYDSLGWVCPFPFTPMHPQSSLLSPAYAAFIAANDLLNVNLTYDPVAFSLPSAAVGGAEGENLMLQSYFFSISFQVFDYPPGLLVSDAEGVSLTPQVTHRFLEGVLTDPSSHIISVCLKEAVVFPIHLSEVPSSARVECRISHCQNCPDGECGKTLGKEAHPTVPYLSRTKEVCDTGRVNEWRVSFPVFNETDDGGRRLSVGPRRYPLTRSKPSLSPLSVTEEGGESLLRGRLLQERLEGRLVEIPWLDTLTQRHLQLLHAADERRKTTGEVEGVLWVLHQVPTAPYPVLHVDESTLVANSLIERQSYLSPEDEDKVDEVQWARHLFPFRVDEINDGSAGKRFTVTTTRLSSSRYIEANSTTAYPDYVGTASFSFPSSSVFSSLLPATSNAKNSAVVPLSIYETQVSLLSSSIYMVLSDAAALPGPRERQRLEELASLPPVPLLVLSSARGGTAGRNTNTSSSAVLGAGMMKADDVALLWRYRHHICQKPKYFIPFLRAVHFWSLSASTSSPSSYSVVWSQQGAAQRMMEAWSFISLSDIFACLSPAFRQVEAVRRLAVSHLRHHMKDDTQLYLYALPLVHCVRYDSLDHELADFLVDRCTRVERRTGDSHVSPQQVASSASRGRNGSRSRGSATPVPRREVLALDSVWALCCQVYWCTSVENHLEKEEEQEKGGKQKLRGPSSTFLRFGRPLDYLEQSLTVGLQRNAPHRLALLRKQHKLVDFLKTLTTRLRAHGGDRQERIERGKQKIIRGEYGLQDILKADSVASSITVADTHPLVGFSNQHTEHERSGTIGESSDTFSVSEYVATTLPSHPEDALYGVRPEDFYIYKSAKTPLRVTFVTRPVNGSSVNAYSDPSSHVPRPVSIMFKMEDDVRQDELVLHLVTVMDQLLCQQGLDLQLSPYRVRPTSATDGILELVPHVVTFESVKKDIPGFWRTHHPTPARFEAALHRYIKSLAGYSVLTFILGVGDRHLENVLLTTDGRLLHIDFGFLFGNDPKPFPPPMKLCREMIAALGGPQSLGFHQFKTYCCSAYNVLRQHAALLLYVLAAFTDAQRMPQVTVKQQWDGREEVEALLKVQEKLRLDLTNTQAAQYMLNIIADSVGSLFAHLWDAIHTAAQAARD